MKNIGLLVLVGSVAMLGGCAKPNLRAAVYDGFGANYSLMRPAIARPVPTDSWYSSNGYTYVPGSLVIPSIAEPRDDIARQAAVWRVNSGEDCPPSPGLLTLASASATPRASVQVEYLFDTRDSIVPSVKTDAVTRAKSDLKLRDNDLRFLERISISFTNVTAYTVTDEMLEKAKADILLPRRCRSFFLRKRSTVQVDAILSGDVFVEVSTAKGASLDLDRVKAKIYNAVSRRYEGKAVFFAVSSRPLGPSN